MVDDLFRLSESRGKEAAGVAVLTDEAIRVYKEAVRATTLIRRRQYGEVFEGAEGGGSRLRGGRDDRPSLIIGHSRLVTTGDQDNRLNNQPVINSGVVGIHNGIIVNDEALWSANHELERHARVDSEIIVSLLRKFLRATGSLVAAVRETFRHLRGAASIAVLFDDLDQMVLATNNGSLYCCGGPERGAMIFASEEYILRRLTGGRRVRGALGDAAITQLRPSEACLVDLRSLRRRAFRLDGRGADEDPVPPRSTTRRIINLVPREAAPGRGARFRPSISRFGPGRFDPPIERCQAAIDRLRRCTRCILPETMPFIEFDVAGVCNYCRNYRRITVRGLDELERLVAPLRRREGRYDCLVGLSGGRDSTYGLHYIKTVLKMNPIAYTYDWGMVTDLARRNISRICGQLGVEHILVSADIETKRRYIRKNVLAWLKRPALGMIPLFMAGDKQYFFHAHRLKGQTGVPLVFLCENMLERTDFKTGFAGVPPSNIDVNRARTVPLGSRLRVAAYYAWQYLLNPEYVNASAGDTLWAYACYYLIPRDYLNLYQYVEWEERTIVETLCGEYDWELAEDTETTWRIGDGTASFYNYIYHTTAGFTENDTFRSNQIRQGVITRAEALARAREENRPRWDSIRWYLSTIGLDDAFDGVIRRINEMPKRYAF